MYTTYNTISLMVELSNKQEVKPKINQTLVYFPQNKVSCLVTTVKQKALLVAFILPNSN